MIYGKLWCVVKPSTGIPLFLGAVAATSLFVHYQLLQATGWLKTYYMGKPKTAMLEQATPTAAVATDVLVVAQAPQPTKQ